VPGQIAHWKAFNSTSKNPNTWHGNTHFTIRNPQTGVDVQKISSHPGEAEVIMLADRMTNVIAICPRDHREAHFGKRRAKIEVEMISKLKIVEEKRLGGVIAS